jgi:tRNA pseudouridine38-40 synthase
VSGTTKLTLEYDGSQFAGWARQPGRRTVQDELERALATVLRHPAVSLTVAGRTDAGVHALAQVASYDGPPASPRSLNALLPDDVAVLSSEAVAPGFSARHDATSRAYCYRVLVRRTRSALERGRALWWPHRIDREALDACAAALAGTHDFTAFTPSESDHVRFEREVRAAAWVREEGSDALSFWIEADAFLRQMNRVLVGTMLEVASGRRSVEAFAKLLEGAPRSAAGKTAPAHGLYLAGVGYDGRAVLDRLRLKLASAVGLRPITIRGRA